MSTLSIRQAFETRLLTLIPKAQTAYENKSFSPVVNNYYAKGELFPAQPDNTVMGASFYMEIGFYQVKLMYPLNAGTGDAQAKAEEIKTLFKRGVTMEEDGLKVHVINTPKISKGFKDGDRWAVPITIFYKADIYL